MGLGCFAGLWTDSDAGLIHYYLGGLEGLLLSESVGVGVGGVKRPYGLSGGGLGIGCYFG